MASVIEFSKFLTAEVGLVHICYKDGIDDRFYVTTTTTTTLLKTDPKYISVFVDQLWSLSAFL